MNEELLTDVEVEVTDVGSSKSGKGSVGRVTCSPSGDGPSVTITINTMAQADADKFKVGQKLVLSLAKVSA